ncbi:MAG: arylsulfatase [Phycisphaerales bacterium]|nr:arylsulfatase [Phycisphaerales bacterium]
MVNFGSPRRELTRRRFLGSIALGAGALGWTLASGAAGKQADPPASRPNFLIILADDMGFSDAGCYGGEIATPNLDKLADDGLKFSQFYSTGRCWPSRSCLMTGYYAQQIRMDPPGGKLPEWTRLAPHYLKPAGYRCYHSGKWHINGARNPCRDGGFDRSYNLTDQHRFFSPKTHTKDDKALKPVKPDSGYYATVAIADHALECLAEHAEKHKGKPFYHYLAFTSPHFPLHAMQKDIDRYKGKYDKGWDVVRAERFKRMTDMGIINCKLSPLQPNVKPSWNLSEGNLAKNIGPGEAGRAVPWSALTDKQKSFQATKMAIHAAMIDRMDREIGRVLKRLKADGVLDNTVVMFISDNGASAEQIIRADMHDKKAAPGSWRSHLCLGPGWSTAANTPFRMHKSWNHEGGIASPLIVHWPAGLKASGELRHNPGHFVDILPTVMELAGVKRSENWKGKPTPPLAGRSIASVFTKDNSVDHDFIYFHHTAHRAIRVGDWKLVSAGKKGTWELYDLKTDRSELNNLAAKHPEKATELSKLWQAKETAFRKQAGPRVRRKRR